MPDPGHDPLSVPWWTSMEVAERAGIGYQMLHRWCESGAVQSTSGGGGTGKVRRWNQFDSDCIAHIGDKVHELAVFELPMTGELVRQLWAALHDHPDDDIVEVGDNGIVFTVDRADLRAIQARRVDALIRRGLED